jgi:hypothetical protein
MYLIEICFSIKFLSYNMHKVTQTKNNRKLVLRWSVLSHENAFLMIKEIIENNWQNTI